MSPFRESIKHLAESLQSCEEWLELVRDLNDPILPGDPPPDLKKRWADKKDLFVINALEGFVKETDFMESALRKGDRCLILENDSGIRAFAWVTFRDFNLALWYILRLQPGWSYLVYIFVHPELGGKGVGSYLLGSLMQETRKLGFTHMISGMYSNWEASYRMHTKLGFRVKRRLSQCRIMNIFPVPPKDMS